MSDQECGVRPRPWWYQGDTIFPCHLPKGHDGPHDNSVRSIKWGRGHVGGEGSR